MTEKKKFVLGDAEDEQELLEAVREDDVILRVKRNCEIRIRNHVAEIKKLNDAIDYSRNEIRKINIQPSEDLPARLSQELRKDVHGIRLKNNIKWRKHLRADIRFLNNQKTKLETEL